jgi:hypothetical protein
MKFLNRPLTTRVRLYQNTLVAILFAGAALQSDAQIYTLSAQNSSLQVDLAGGGITQWTIDGVNQLNNQWFYYSIGSGPAYSIDSIAPWSTPTITSGSLPTLTETYANASYSVQTKFVLQPAAIGTGRAKLSDTITVRNLSATALDFHFYQYSDFDLGGVTGDQAVQFDSNGAGTAYKVVQTGLAGATLTGTAVAVGGGVSVPALEQAALYDGSKFGLGSGNPVSLNNTNLTAGPGNVVYAYQWNVTLAAAGNPGSSLTISEIQSVPEPSTAALIASGMIVLAMVCRRRPGGQRHGVSN